MPGSVIAMAAMVSPEMTPRHPALLLLGGRVRHEVRGHDVGVHARRPGADPGARGLLPGDHLVGVADAGAAVGLRHVEAEQAGVAETAQEVVGHAPGGLPVGLVRGGLLEDLAHDCAEVLVVRPEEGALHGSDTLTGPRSGARGCRAGQGRRVTWYAQTPALRTRQQLTDLAVAVWTLVWLRVGVALHEAVQRLGAPGRGLQDAGDELQGGLSGAAERAGDLPLVGGGLRSPLDAAAGAGRALSRVGVAQEQAVDRLAVLLAVLVVALPVAWAVNRWLPGRLAWSRDAAAATFAARRRGAPRAAGRDDAAAARAGPARPRPGRSLAPRRAGCGRGAGRPAAARARAAGGCVLTGAGGASTAGPCSDAIAPGAGAAAPTGTARRSRSGPGRRRSSGTGARRRPRSG